MGKLEPGAYTGEDGVQRFWDGEQWLTPTPSGSAPKLDMEKIKRPLILGGTALVVIVGTIFGYSALSESQKKADFEEQVALEKQAYESRAKLMGTFFDRASRDCDAGDEVESGRDYMSVKTWGKESFTGVSYATFVCLLDAIEMPPQVEDRVMATRALDGTLNGDWDILNGDGEVTAEWSYHPDSGSRLTVELESKYFDPFVAPEY